MATPMQADNLASAERRQAPRTTVARPALVRTPRRLVYRATAHDLSLGGLRLDCPRFVACALTTTPDGDVALAPCEVQWTLLIDDRLLQLNAVTRALYMRPLDERQAAVGLRFVELEAHARDLLAAFLAAPSRPAD